MGTYLACEENFNGYFSSSDLEFSRTEAMERCRVKLSDWGYGWASVGERFDISKHPNEANRAGYVVEIDPFDPESTPKKKTAHGRFKHENADMVIADDGRVVVHMGDDERRGDCSQHAHGRIVRRRHHHGPSRMGCLQS